MPPWNDRRSCPTLLRAVYHVFFRQYNPQRDRHTSDYHGTLTSCSCLLYTSDAADDLLCVDLGGRRIIKKKTADALREELVEYFFFFFSSRRRHTRSCLVSWARRCV